MAAAPAPAPAPSSPQPAAAPESAPVRVTVLFFARARDEFGVPQLELEFPAGSSVSAVRSALLKRTPSSAALFATPGTCIARNCDAVEDEASEVLADGDELSVIPPVSGG